MGTIQIRNQMFSTFPEVDSKYIVFFRAYLGIPVLKALALPCIEKSMLYKLQKVTFIIVNAK